MMDSEKANVLVHVPLIFSKVFVFLLRLVRIIQDHELLRRESMVHHEVPLIRNKVDASESGYGSACQPFDVWITHKKDLHLNGSYARRDSMYSSSVPRSPAAAMFETCARRTLLTDTVLKSGRLPTDTMLKSVGDCHWWILALKTWSNTTGRYHAQVAVNIAVRYHAQNVSSMCPKRVIPS